MARAARTWSGAGTPCALTALVGLGRQPLWYDEVPTSRASGLPWPGLVHLVSRTDANIGAYYAFLHVWRVFGNGPLALRLPSALASIATVIVTERVGRRLLGPGPAVLGAALLAVHPFATTYARDARPYALVTLACMTALLLELRAREDPTARRLAGCEVVAALAVLLHLYAVLPLAAFGLALLPADRSERRRRVVAHLAVVPVVLGVLLVSLHQQGQLAWVPGLSLLRVLSGLALLSGGAAPLVAVAGIVVWAARGGLPEPARRVLLAGVLLPVRAAARTLVAEQQPGDGVVFEQQGARLGLDYYLARLHRPGAPTLRDVLAAPSAGVIGFGVPEIGRAAVSGALSPYRRLWVAWHRDSPRRPLPALAGFTCRPHGRYGLLELDLCRARPSQPGPG